MDNEEDKVNHIVSHAKIKGMTSLNYVKLCMGSDPTFMTYLLGDHIDNWGLGMTKEDRKKLNKFLDKLVLQ